MHVQSVQKNCFSLSNMQICGVLLPSSSWLLKLPTDTIWWPNTRGLTRVSIKAKFQKQWKTVVVTMETLPERFALTKNPAISKVTNKLTSSRYQNHESWQQGRREENVSLRETLSSEPFLSASCVLFKVLEIQLQYTYSTLSSFLPPNG